MLDKLLLLSEKYPLDFIVHLSSSLPISLGLFRYRYLSLVSKLTVVFFLTYFIQESFALWLSLLKQNNLYLQNIEIIPDLVLLLIIALLSFQSILLKRILIFFAIFCFAVSFLTYRGNAVSSESLSAFRLFAIFVCLAYFNKILIDTRIKNILLHTLFWFMSGLLIYATGTFFIFLFSEYIFDPQKTSIEEFDKYWNVSQVLFIIFSLISTYGLWVSKYDQENIL